MQERSYQHISKPESPPGSAGKSLNHEVHEGMLERFFPSWTFASFVVMGFGLIRRQDQRAGFSIAVITFLPRRTVP